MSRKKDFNFDEMLGTGMGGPENAVELLAETEHSENGPTIGLSMVSGGDEIQEIITALLAAHVGLRTGLAKKTTFDFTPEFARALKRWSVDVDTPMRDLVVKAVAQVIPVEYIQEYRNTGIQKG